MRRLFTCVLLSLALPAAAQTPDWQLISQSGNRGQVINWYVDASSIVRTDDYLRAVLRTSWSAPQYGPDHATLAAAVRAALPPGLAVAGNYLDGIGVPACAAAAGRAVEAVLAPRAAPLPARPMAP